MSVTESTDGTVRTAPFAGSGTSGRAVSPRRLLLLALGFGIWCSALVILYALHAVGCAFGWQPVTIRLGLIVTVLVHLAALAALWRHHARTAPDPAQGATGAFLGVTVVWTLVSAFVTLAFTLCPTLLMTTCK